MLDINVGVVICADRRFEATTFPNQGDPFNYTATLNEEEMEYFLVMLRSADLASRPQGSRTGSDGGNWEGILKYQGRTNHVYWLGPAIEAEESMFWLDYFLWRLAYQPEVARRLSLGHTDTLVGRCLQPYRFVTNSPARGQVDSKKQQVRGAAGWRTAKPLLAGLVPLLTPAEWCGLVACFLKNADAQEQGRGIADIWRGGEVVWPEIKGHAKMLRPVLLQLEKEHRNERKL